MLCRQSNNPAGVLQAAKPIRRYIMGSNHSFIGGLGENYAALGENWHINFQSPSLKKAKRKAYKRHKTACRLNFFGAAGGIRTLVGLLPNWFRVSPVMTTSIPLRVFFATSALKKHPGKRRELMERTTKNFLLNDTSKALKNQGFSEKQFQSGHSFSSQARYDHFDTLPCNNYSVFNAIRLAYFII